MSLARCQTCDRIIYTDDDPDCFIEHAYLDIEIKCEWCREVGDVADAKGEQQ